MGHDVDMTAVRTPHGTVAATRGVELGSPQDD